jgi:uncharacterized protein (TIGR04222 family)
MTFNPLDLPGPPFLIFYAIVGSLTLVVVWAVTRVIESSWPMPKLKLHDPYEIAFLRGGKKEALSLATFSLVDRGLLDLSQEILTTKKQTAIRHAQKPIEQVILKKFLRTPGALSELQYDLELDPLCGNYRSSLCKQRLLAGGSAFLLRMPMFIIGLLIVGGLAGAKLVVALQRGHHNVFFLICLAIVFLCGLTYILFQQRTGLGDRLLTDLRILFKDLNNRGHNLKRGGLTNEASLLVAVFGFEALSQNNFPQVAYFSPSKPTSKSSNSPSWLSCGSSCGSSCGGGCGGCGGD